MTLVSRKPLIEVCFTPSAISGNNLTGKTVVVIDVLRATSTIAVALHHKAEKIIPVDSLEKCMGYKDSGFLLAAERKGEKVEGFSYGNSPFEYMDERIAGKTIVLTTTNGTKALHMSKDAAAVVTGAFVNFSALCTWLESMLQDTVLVCAGWNDKINLEDSIFAGCVIGRMRSAYEPAGDAEVMAESLFSSAQEDLYAFMKRSSHFHRLMRLGYERDIRHCLSFDSAPVVPVFDGEQILRAELRGIGV